MGNNGRISGSSEIERKLMEQVKLDDTARRMKSQYNRGMALGLCAIILSTLLFAASMFLLTSQANTTNVIVAVIAAALMIVCLIVVPIRLKKLQSGWFGASSDTARDYAQKIIEDQYKKTKK
jgi:hypothetical protein